MSITLTLDIDHFVGFDAEAFHQVTQIVLGYEIESRLTTPKPHHFYELAEAFQVHATPGCRKVAVISRQNRVRHRETQGVESNVRD